MQVQDPQMESYMIQKFLGGRLRKDLSGFLFVWFISTFRTSRITFWNWWIFIFSASVFERWLLWNNNCCIDDKRRNKKYRKTTSWENKMTWLLTKCNKHTVYFFLSTVVAIPFFLCPFYVSQHWQIRLWIPPDLAVRLHQRPTKREDKWKYALE